MKKKDISVEMQNLSILEQEEEYYDSKDEESKNQAEGAMAYRQDRVSSMSYDLENSWKSSSGSRNLESNFQSESEYSEIKDHMHNFHKIKTIIYKALATKNIGNIDSEKEIGLLDDNDDYIVQGDLFFSRYDEYQKALDCYDEAILDSNLEHIAYNHKAILYNHLQEFEKANICIENGIKCMKESDSDAIYYTKVINLYNQRQYNAGENLLRKLESKKIKGNDLESIMSKGYMYYGLQKYDEALKCFIKASKLPENNHLSIAYNVIGNVKADQGDNDGAIKAYKNAIKNDNNHISTYYNLGLLYMEIGGDDFNVKAIKCFNKLINENSTKIALPYALKGKILLKLGEYKKANDCFTKALDEFDKSDLLTQGIMKELIFNSVHIKNLIEKEHQSKKLNEKDQDNLSDTLKKLQHQIDLQGIEIQQNERILFTQENVLKEIGAYEETQIKTDFRLLLEENEKLGIYCKFFYWTLCNYFSACKILSTDLIQKNTDACASDMENIAVYGAKNALHYGADIASSIPFIGGITNIIDDMVDYIVDSTYEYIKERRFDNKMNAINSVFLNAREQNMAFEKDMMLLFAQIAINLTKLKKAYILDEQEEEQGNFSKVREWISQKFEMLKNNIFVEDVELYNSKAGKCALEDVVLLLSYIVAHYKNINENKTPLVTQLTEAVLHGDDDLFNKDKKDQEDEMPKSCKDKFCEMFKYVFYFKCLSSENDSNQSDHNSKLIGEENQEHAQNNCAFFDGIIYDY